MRRQVRFLGKGKWLQSLKQYTDLKGNYPTGPFEAWNMGWIADKSFGDSVTDAQFRQLLTSKFKSLGKNEFLWSQKINFVGPDRKVLCKDTCSYQGYSNGFPYVVLGVCAKACPNPYARLFGQMVNMMTNPTKSTKGWSSNGQGVADLCANRLFEVKDPKGRTVSLQQFWSNHAGKCVGNSFASRS